VEETEDKLGAADWRFKPDRFPKPVRFEGLANRRTCLATAAARGSKGGVH